MEGISLVVQRMENANVTNHNYISSNASIINCLAQHNYFMKILKETQNTL